MAASAIDVEQLEEIADKLLVELSLEELTKLAGLLELSREMLTVTNKRQMLRYIRKELEELARVAAGTDEAVEEDDDDTRQGRAEALSKLQSIIKAMEALVRDRKDGILSDEEKKEREATRLMMEESKQLTKEVEEIQQMLAEKKKKLQKAMAVQKNKEDRYTPENKDLYGI